MFEFERGRIKLIHGGKYPHCHSVFIDDNFRAVIDEREAKMREFLGRGPRTLDEIAAAGLIYGNKSIEGAWSWANSERTMMRKHLERLIRAGMVARDRERFRLS